MANLQSLMQAARPLKKFSVTIGGNTFDLVCRKRSMSEDRIVSDVWQKAYEEEVQSLDGDDTASIFANLKRQPKEKLAEYIARADRIDLVAEAMIFFPDAKDTQDERVQTKADELVKEREAELVKDDADHLLAEAMKRRTHIAGLIKAATAGTKATLFYTVYNEDGTRFFESQDQVEELDEDTIETLNKAVAEALEPPKDSPLNSAATPA